MAFKSLDGTGMRPVMVVRACKALFAAALLAASAGAVVGTAGQAFGQALPTDPRITTGTLSNGMAYKIMPHANPPGRAAFYIHVSTGSLNETDAQRGIAHYLEHMAFNGSKNFPPGTVIDFFQSMGLSFGRHQNAFTSFDQTAYILEMPNNKPETVETGFRFFSDVAFNLLLPAEEIEKERQVIMEEKRTRIGAQQRVQEYMLERYAPGSLLGVRLPIGVEQTIMGMQRADFVDYYTRWYTPANMTVIVVADMPVDQVKPLIEKNFSQGQKAPKPVDQDPKVTPNTTTRAIIATDAELKRADVGIMKVDRPLPPITTVADYRRDLVERLASGAFNRKLDAKQSAGNFAALTMGASVGQLANTIRMTGVSAGGEPGKWRQMLTEAAAELQRAMLHGLSDRDIEETKKEFLADAEQFAKSEPTLPAAVHLRRINTAVAEGETVMSGEQNLALMRELVPTISNSEISEAFKQIFEPKNVTFTLQMPASASDIPSEAELIEFGLKALDVKPEADKETAAVATMMEKLPTPGTVKDATTHAESGVTLATLSNNTKVAHRFMDYRKNNATIIITLAGGTIEETAANRGITDAAAIAWGKPATSTLSSTNLRDLMSGKKVNVGGGNGADTMTLSISGDPADLEEGMKLAHLMLTDPKVEQAEFDQWKARTIQGIEQRKASPQGQMSEIVADSMWPKGEVRNRPLEKAQVEKITLADAQAWLTRIVKNAPMEVTVVGDLPQDKAMELVTRYVASVPARPAMTPETLDSLRKVDRVAGPISTTREIETTTPLAMGVSGFFASDAENVKDTRLLNMASQIISTRMIKSIREEKQLVYSIRASLRPGDAYTGMGMLFAGAPTEPGKTDKLAAALREEYDKFAKEGPNAEELETAKKQMANTFDEQMKEPSWWAGRLTGMTMRNMKIDDVMTAPAAFQAMTADDIKAAFNKYYTPANQIEIFIKPKGTTTAEPAPANGSTGGTKPQG